MTNLTQRCAAYGWALRADGDGWELLGNGSPAAFGSTASLEAWLERQEPPKVRPTNYLNQIVTGDARLLAEQIPDESVDMIFTDPVYERIENYAWLAETAARVLKPSRSLLAFYGGPKPGAVMSALDLHMRYRWTLSYYVAGKASKLRGYNMFVHTTPVYWYVKGNGKPHRCIIDTMRCVPHYDALDNSLNFEWNKHPSYIAYYLQAFTQIGDVVYDPFMGGGTTAVVCRTFGRSFIGSERDPERAEKARQRLANTQAIHPVFLENQTALFESEAA